MCGICGYVARTELAVAPERLHAMRDVLRHRGPDGAGEANLGDGSQSMQGWLGHRRLKIIDLGDSGDQPMWSDDRKIVLTYNGEIYNFLELRRELAAGGARFRSTGDTEVVLRAYEAWGEDAVSRLDGMFAFALWDGRSEKLLLARDRTGKKPLFYSVAEGRFAFGSEIKALLACPWIEAKPALERLPELLTYGYVPWPHTMYEGILQVPPGSVLSVDGDGVQGPRRYWDAVPSSTPLRAGADLYGRVADLLRGATRRRMVADVPLGALLSGGIDSSLVVGLMTEAAEEPVHSFSIGFPEEPSFDERAAARAVAQHFGTRHTEFSVELDAVALIDRLLWHHDQPYADSSAIPTYTVSRLAREHVTVVLNGDGGDEVFGGYDRFVAAALARRMPASLVRPARRLVGRLPGSHGYYSPRRRAQRFLELAHLPALDRYQSWIAVANRELLPELLSPSLAPLADPAVVEHAMRREYERAGHLPMLDQILFANFATYLPDDLSVKMDRMSMASSLEARSPFLDTALVETLARVPARDKVGIRTLKPILRRAFGPLLPAEVWDRKKHGFGVPMGAWMRGELGTMFGDEVLAPGARSADLLDRETVRGLFDEHRGGEVDNGFRLWTLLMLERWLRSLESPPPLEPPAEAVVDASDRAPA